jgi:hypothetical protein
MDTSSYVSECFNFVNFSEDNKIDYESDFVKYMGPYANLPVYIISILGNARGGKSSLLNCLASHLTRNNKTIFKTSSSIDHCTKGIDACFVKPNGYEFMFMLVDCQGINYGDSAIDCKFMLIPYDISDMIIFCENNIIGNATLKSLEPMHLFEKYIDNYESRENKPILLMRVRDYSLDENINKMLDFTVKLGRNDQYECIRKTINKLFSSTSAVSTDSLNSYQRKMLANNQYLEILEEKCGFREVCKEIVEKTKSQIKFKHLDSKFTDNLNYIVGQINNNKKIDCSLLDVYTLNLKNELREFSESIDKELLKDINDITFDNGYHGFLTLRRDKYKDICNDFNMKFKRSDARFVDPVKNQMENRLRRLEDDLKRCESFAVAECVRILNEIFDNNKPLINKFTLNKITESCEKSFEYIKNILITEYANKTKEIVTPIVKNILQHMLIDEIIGIIEKKYKNHEANFLLEIKKTIAFFNKTLDSMLTSELINQDTVDIQKNYDIQPFKQMYIDSWAEFWRKNKGCYKKYFTMTFTVKLDKEEYEVNFVENVMENYNGGIIQNYNEDSVFHKKINSFFEMNVVRDYYKKIAIEKINKYLLDNRVYNVNNDLFKDVNDIRRSINDITKKIIECNPDVKFHVLQIFSTGGRENISLLFKKYYPIDTRCYVIFLDDRELGKDTFSHFINENITIIDGRFTSKVIKEIFSKNVNPDTTRCEFLRGQKFPSLNIKLYRSEMHFYTDYNKELYTNDRISRYIISKINDFYDNEELNKYIIKNGMN